MPGEKGFRYVYSTKHITDILEKIQKTGRPDILNAEYLKKTWLLKNNNYALVLQLLKDMEFIDDSGHPLDYYKKYQNPTYSKTILAAGIKKAYPDLFQAYPKAWKEPKNIIQGYFKEHTGAAPSVLGKIFLAFETLCNNAEFTETEQLLEEGQEYKSDKQEEYKTKSFKVEPNIQVNIGINIAADTPDDKIKVIFENMKKYLLTKDNE